MKEITLISPTTEVTLRASLSDKGLEIDLKGLGQAMSFQREGKEFAKIGSDGKITNAQGFVGPLTGNAATATTATNLVAGTPVIADERTFTEAGAGTYTATMAIPAGSIVQDVIWANRALWDAVTSATLNVGDGDDADGFIIAVDVKTAPIADVAGAGGISNLKASTGTGAYKGLFKRYVAAGTITATVVSVGAGTLGRSDLFVFYSTPASTAATKV